jgi:hypothetical protein
MLGIPRVYPTGLGTRGCAEDPRVTRTGFVPDPYTGTVFAGPGTGRPEGTRGYTHVHPYEYAFIHAHIREFCGDSAVVPRVRNLRVYGL